MDLISTVKAFVAQLPIAVVTKARLEFSAEQLAVAEKKIADLELQVARVKAELESVRLEKGREQEENRELKEQLAEEVRLIEGIEFRRSRKTGGVWTAFCPICSLPATTKVGIQDGRLLCPSGNCRWRCQVIPVDDLRLIRASLPA